MRAAGLIEKLKGLLRLRKKERSGVSLPVKSGKLPGCGEFLRISYATDKGLIRQTNEDSFFIDGRCRHSFGKNEHDCYIELTGGTHVFGIFDGMGGEAHGETAAALSAIAFEREFEELSSAEPLMLQGIIDRFCRSANSLIRDMLRERSAERGGSTFAAVCVRNGLVYPFYLGDSRVYLRCAGSITPLTADHTVAAEKIRAGLCTEEEARGSREHHMLTHFLGEDTAHSGLSATACPPAVFGEGSAVVMCTDGLYDMLTDEEISAALNGSDDPAAELIRLALSRGGADNVTCIVIENLSRPAGVCSN